METPIVLPNLGADDEPIRVSCWLVDPGDVVESSDRVVEVMIQGITFDVAVPVAGVVSRIEKPFDSVVAPGDILGWIQPNAMETDG